MKLNLIKLFSFIIIYIFQIVCKIKISWARNTIQVRAVTSNRIDVQHFSNVGNVIMMIIIIIIKYILIMTAIL